MEAFEWSDKGDDGDGCVGKLFEWDEQGEHLGTATLEIREEGDTDGIAVWVDAEAAGHLVAWLRAKYPAL